MTVENNKLDELMEKYGFNEKEAEAWYYLRMAKDLLKESIVDPDIKDSNLLAARTGLIIMPHFNALENLLAREVLKRERPSGWGE